MTTYDDGDAIIVGTSPPADDASRETQRSGTAGKAADESKRVAGTAADEGQRVAQVAADEAKQVAGEARQQAANLMEEARTQLSDQSRTQRDRLVGTLRSATGDLEKMASGEGGSDGMAADLVRQAASRAREFADRIDGREPAELLDELRGFARRRPGTFLLGALVAGVVVGRLTRGARDANSSQPHTSGSAAPLGTSGYTGAYADVPGALDAYDDPGAVADVTPPPFDAGAPLAGPGAGSGSGRVSDDEYALTSEPIGLAEPDEQAEESPTGRGGL